jgi:hypothetical protein
MFWPLRAYNEKTRLYPPVCPWTHVQPDGRSIQLLNFFYINCTSAVIYFMCGCNVMLYPSSFLIGESGKGPANCGACIFMNKYQP